MIGNLWIIWSNKVSEHQDCVFLSYFEDDAWSVTHVLNQRKILRQHTLVYIIEFFDLWSTQVEHLGSWDLKATLQYHIKDLACLSRFNYMWLDNAKWAIIQHSGGFHAFVFSISSEEEFNLTSCWFIRVTSMDSVFGSISTKDSSNRVWCLLLCSIAIGWSDELSPLCYSIIGDQLHPNDNITYHELLQIWEEWLSNMFPIKDRSGFFCEFGHFKFVNREAFGLDGVDDFANVLIWAWFNHSKGSWAAFILFASGGEITIGYDMKHSAEDCNLSSNKQIIKFHFWHFNPLKENLLYFLIIHFDGVVHRKIEQTVVSDDVSLWIIPFSFEDVSLFLDWLGEGHICFFKLFNKIITDIL